MLFAGQSCFPATPLTSTLTDSPDARMRSMSTPFAFPNVRHASCCSRFNAERTKNSAAKLVQYLLIVLQFSSFVPRVYNHAFQESLVLGCQLEHAAPGAQVPILRLSVLTICSAVCGLFAQASSHCLTKLQNSRQPLLPPELPRVSFE